MSQADHVSISITSTTVNPSRAGFGIPLVLSHNATFTALVEFVTSLGGVTDLGFAVTSPEYLAVQRIFSQNPRPPTVAIGRADGNKPTQKYTWTPNAINSHDYILQVEGDGVTSTECKYTSDASATVAEICTGMVALLNAVAGKNFTASDDTTHVTITGSAAGEWFSIEQVNVGDGAIIQDHADPGVATDLAAIIVENNTWYGLVTCYNSNAYVLAAAAWAEANKKLYGVDSSDSASITAAAGGGDTLDDLKTSAYVRSFGIYHPSPAKMAAAGWIGKCFPKDPGSQTWKFKTIAGLPSVALTETHKTNLKNKNATGYATYSGLNITLEGKTGDGEYIDVQRSIDWIEAELFTDIFAAQAGEDKIPFTDTGIALIQGLVDGVLRRAVNQGILESYTVTVPTAASQSAANKASRTLTGVEFSGVLQGAIHKANITGSVSA